MLVVVLKFKRNRQCSEQLNFLRLRGIICSTFRKGHSYTDRLQEKLFSSSFLSFPFVFYLPFFSSITFLFLLFFHPANIHSFLPSSLPPSFILEQLPLPGPPIHPFHTFISSLHSPLISDKNNCYLLHRGYSFSQELKFIHISYAVTQTSIKRSLKTFCHASDAAGRLVTTAIHSISDIGISFNFKLKRNHIQEIRHIFIQNQSVKMY